MKYYALHSVGAGAIGSTVEGHLHRTSHEVILVGSSRHLDRIQLSSSRPKLLNARLRKSLRVQLSMIVFCLIIATTVVCSCISTGLIEQQVPSLYTPRDEYFPS